MWEECEEKDCTAYAVLRDELYLCRQGSEVWYQDDCKGWAICSSDKDWVGCMADETGGGIIVPMRLT